MKAESEGWGGDVECNWLVCCNDFVRVVFYTAFMMVMMIVFPPWLLFARSPLYFTLVYTKKKIALCVERTGN